MTTSDGALGRMIASATGLIGGRAPRWSSLRQMVAHRSVSSSRTGTSPSSLIARHAWLRMRVARSRRVAGRTSIGSSRRGRPPAIVNSSRHPGLSKRSRHVTRGLCDGRLTTVVAAAQRQAVVAGYCARRRAPVVVTEHTANPPSARNASPKSGGCAVLPEVGRNDHSRAAIASDSCRRRRPTVCECPKMSKEFTSRGSRPCAPRMVGKSSFLPVPGAPSPGPCCPSGSVDQ